MLHAEFSYSKNVWQQHKFTNMFLTFQISVRVYIYIYIKEQWYGETIFPQSKILFTQ